MSARRRVLGALAVAPLAARPVCAAPDEAPDRTPAGAALEALERLAAEVIARLHALETRVPPARAFLTSALRDQARLAGERRALRWRLGLVPSEAAPEGVASADVSLAGLRAAQEALVYAHAEALPELGDPAAVDRLARHMTDLARHLTLIDLWIEAEAQRE